MRFLINWKLAATGLLTIAFGGSAAATEPQSDGFSEALRKQQLSNWHQWRGPLDCGVSPTANPPIQWSETENVKWKVAIPGSGSGSPIVWENRVYVTSAVPTPKPKGAENANANSLGSQVPGSQPPGAGNRRGGGRGGFGGEAAPTNAYQFIVMCLDRDSGKEIWRRTAIEKIPHEGTHSTNTYASASASTDGTHLFVSFGSQGIFCFDMDGNPIWDRDLGDMQTRNGFGEGGSPTLWGNKLIVPWDHEGQSFIAALDANTGKTIWQVERDEPTTWATPLVVERPDLTQVITNGTVRVRSYNIENGELLWECGGQATNPIPSPIEYENGVICMTGYRGYAVYNIPLDSKGDVTGSNKIIWKRTDAAPYVSSAVLYKDQLYYTKSRDAAMSIIDAKTGDAIVDQQRIPAVSSFYASPVAAADRIYFTSREGATAVLKHGKSLEVLATNQLDEGIDASPAIVGNQMFLRGQNHLYCISEE